MSNIISSGQRDDDKEYIELFTAVIQLGFLNGKEPMNSSMTPETNRGSRGVHTAGKSTILILLDLRRANCIRVMGQYYQFESMQINVKLLISYIRDLHDQNNLLASCSYPGSLINNQAKCQEIENVWQLINAGHRQNTAKVAAVLVIDDPKTVF